MEYLVICLVSLLVAGLTFFSGFGLGTLLMPVFALFFPVEVAVAATAVVHLFNNLFKVLLVGNSASLRVVGLFAIPAALTAAAGAWLLNYFSMFPVLYQYNLGDKIFEISAVKLVIAFVMLIFAMVEIIPVLDRISFSTRLIPLGGMLSGFFGGLSGHQGALRTAFLVRVGLEKKVLIGTMVISAVIVDISRLLIYGLTFFERDFSLMSHQGTFNLVIAGCLAAFVGSFLGSRLLEKITLKSLKLFISIMLFLIAFALAAGAV